ncbi:TolC family protein [Sessilibacter sp. MAH4]
MAKPLVISLLVLCLISGCASHGGREADYSVQAGELAASVDWPQQASAETAPGSDTLAMTDLIDSPELQQLVAEALAHNPSLQQTFFALQQSQQRLQQAKGSRYPSVDATISGSKREQADSQYSGSLNVSWQYIRWLYASRNVSQTVSRNKVIRSG